MYMRVAQPSETSWHPALCLSCAGPREGRGEPPHQRLSRNSHPGTNRSAHAIHALTKPLMVIDGNSIISGFFYECKYIRTQLTLEQRRMLQFCRLTYV